MPSAPETRYAKSGDLNIAYQVAGEGSLDLIYLPGWISNVEVNWEEPGRRRRRARKVELEELERNWSHKMDSTGSRQARTTRSRTASRPTSAAARALERQSRSCG